MQYCIIRNLYKVEIIMTTPVGPRGGREGGELEDQVIEFAWDTITTFEIDEDSSSFIFQYRRAGKPDRTVRIYSHFYVFLFECFEKIQEEIGWTKQLESHQ